MTRLEIIHELHAEAPAAVRCPHLEHDDAGCSYWRGGRRAITSGDKGTALCCHHQRLRGRVHSSPLSINGQSVELRFLYAVLTHMLGHEGV